jgi:hypothetical protein
MAEIQDFSATDASNTGRWPENMQFSAVNNAGRADEGLLGRWYKDTDGSVTASGSSNAFTATSNRTIVALFNNLTMTITANHTITGASTLNLNGLGAKTIKRFNGDGLASGDITSGQPFTVIYKSSPDIWYMMTAAASLATGGTYFDFTENASPGTPGADVARLYALDDGSGNTVLAYIDSAATVTHLRGATAAEMEALTANRLTPVSLQHRHPGHPKAGGTFNGQGTPAITAGDYGLTSIADNGTGLYTITFDTAFSNANYWQTAWARSYSGATSTIVNGAIGGTKTTTQFALRTAETTTGNAVDPQEVCMVWWGDQ